MKHVFIINSISGKGKALSLIPTIEKVCIELKLDYEIIPTQYINHAKRIANNYNSDAIIYACGGDGTILEVLNGLNKDIPLAIIPSGSGNDFYRQFSNNIKDYEKLIKDTINAPIIEIDYGICNGLKFINTTSIGIDSNINEYASYLIRNTFLTKGIAYVYSIFKHVINPKAQHFKIICDNHLLEDNYLIINIMNGQYYGNGVYSAPNAIINDGYFDLILAKNQKRLKIYHLLIKYLSGNHLNDKNFTFIKAQNINIYADKKISIQSDGENYHAKEIKLELIKKGLKLKAPYNL